MWFVINTNEPIQMKFDCSVNLREPSYCANSLVNTRSKVCNVVAGFFSYQLKNYFLNDLIFKRDIRAV